MASIERPNDPASHAFRRFREHGEPAAMTEVFDLVGHELFALAAHIARDAAEAEDLVQEVFLAALAGARRFDPSRAVTPWLVGILVKEARKARRGRAQRERPRAQNVAPRDQRDGASTDPERTAPHTEAPLAKALTGEVRLAVARALEGVPQRYRDVLQPVLEDGVAPTALAATLGRAPGTVRAQLHRGLELLRKALPHTLAPALVPPFVSALALELGTGRGLAAIRADLARRAALDGPGLALAGAGVLVTPSLPLLGVIVMQTKVLAAIAATAVIGVALLVQRNDGARPMIEPTPALVAPTEASLVAGVSAPMPSTEEPRPDERTAVPATEPGKVASSAEVSAMATLAVNVVDEGGVGLPRLQVSLQPTLAELDAARKEVPDGISPLRHISAQSDASGWLTLQVPAGRALELRCSGVGSKNSSETVDIEALEPGSNAEALIRIRTRPDTEVYGRVVDAATGAPLSGIAVHVSEKLGQSSRIEALPLPEAPHAVTDVNGEFRAPARSWLTTGAVFTGAGWSPQLAWLRNADDWAGDGTSGAPSDAVEVALRPSACIEGMVNNGRPGLVIRGKVAQRELVRDIRDNVQRLQRIEGFGGDFELTAIVDEVGAFVLHDVPSAAAVHLSLTEEQRRSLVLQEPSPVRVDAGSTHRVNWILGRGGRLVCTVRETNGDPGVDEEVWLAPAGEGPGRVWGLPVSPSKRARTDQRGVAVFEDVQPGSWIVALAPLQQRRAEPGDAARYAVAATIDASGEVVPVELTLHRDQWITGRVVAPDGSPAPSSISAFRGDHSAHVQWHEFVDGAFRLGPLLPGRYTMQASRFGRDDDGGPPLMGSEFVEFDAGATDVELRLRLGVAVVLTAIDPKSDVAVPARIELVGRGLATGTAQGVEPKVTFAGHEPGYDDTEPGQSPPLT